MTPRSSPTCSTRRCSAATPRWSRQSPARRCPATRAWRRAARSVAPTTSTGRSGTSTSTRCSSGSSARPVRPRRRSTRARPPTDGSPSVSLTPARGAAAPRRVPGADRAVAPGDRERDPAAPGRRPGQRGAGPLVAQAAARGRRRDARDPRGAGRDAQVAPAAVAQARGPPRPQAAPRPQGAARLPVDDAPLAVDRWRAGRPQVPLPAAVQAGDRGDRRHLRFGGLVRPVHPPPGARHLDSSSPRCGASCSSTGSTR